AAGGGQHAQDQARTERRGLRVGRRRPGAGPRDRPRRSAGPLRPRRLPPRGCRLQRGPGAVPLDRQWRQGPRRRCRAQPALLHRGVVLM
ncbi:MAG: hypothetical protein AVDCRST_MAG07-288, partial [uncultured Frankineae bacterium]